MTSKNYTRTLVKDGKKLFAILPYNESSTLEDRLANAEDLLELRRAKRRQRKQPSLSLNDAKDALDLSKARHPVGSK